MHDSIPLAIKLLIGRGVPVVLVESSVSEPGYFCKNLQNAFKYQINHHQIDYGDRDDEPRQQLEGGNFIRLVQHREDILRHYDVSCDDRETGLENLLQDVGEPHRLISGIFVFVDQHGHPHEESEVPEVYVVRIGALRCAGLLGGFRFLLVFSVIVVHDCVAVHLHEVCARNHACESGVCGAPVSRQNLVHCIGEHHQLSGVLDQNLKGARKAQQDQFLKKECGVGP